MSEIKVNKLSSRTGNAVTLGTSGDTFTIPAGVTLTNSGTATGFGSDSDISWQAVKTADFTAVAGEGYFIDSSGGAITMTLPASPSLGDTVAAVSLDGATNTVTIARNSSNIEGGTDNLSLGANYAAVTLIYSDAANGWYRHNNEAPDTFISATGGTATTSGSFKIHTFNSSSNFVVSSLSSVTANNTVDYLVVGGGGGGGAGVSGGPGGGGGAGGMREAKDGTVSSPHTASPLATTTGITVTASTYPITVGAGGGGVPGTGQGSTGSNSVFSTITSAGGGGGGGASCNGINGGSGGGGGPSGGSGNTPPVSPSQGSNGGTGAAGPSSTGGGGGGSTAVGTNGSTSGDAGDGGAGATTSISGSSTAYAGGGGGSYENAPATVGTAGTGGGGAGGHVQNCGTVDYVAGAGTANTGGGGGGSGGATPAGPYMPGKAAAGGSGVVIIRYKYQ